MNIKDFGGEFKLIQTVTKKPKFHPCQLGVGDDCAVIPQGKHFQIITKDMLVENDHFSLDYFTPKQIGIKVAESNLSDIAAMGGKPTYAFLAFSLRNSLDVAWVKSFYQGLYSRFNKNKVDLLGGDTTHGSTITVSLTLMGIASKKHLTYRSGAQVGDLIKVTGSLGASTAGFKLFQKELPDHTYVKKKHLEPCSRLDLVDEIAPYANAMADISDGLAADLGNILAASKKAAILDRSAIPIRKETTQAATSMNEDAIDYALNGGEDFELVYTVPKTKASKTPGIVVGEIIPGKKLFLKSNGKILPIPPKGFNHFS